MFELTIRGFKHSTCIRQKHYLTDYANLSLYIYRYKMHLKSQFAPQVLFGIWGSFKWQLFIPWNTIITCMCVFWEMGAFNFLLMFPLNAWTPQSRVLISFAGDEVPSFNRGTTKHFICNTLVTVKSKLSLTVFQRLR